MKCTKLSIDGALMIESRTYTDERGCFRETFRRSILSDNGVKDDWVQENQSRSRKNVVRGLHYQCGPHAQAKLIGVVRGSIFDAIVDLRQNSPTYLKWFGEVLSDTNNRQIYVPAGCAHGFLALEDCVDIRYMCSEYYSPANERGVFWADPTIAIEWPVSKDDVIISAKDNALPKLSSIIEIGQQTHPA